MRRRLPLSLLMSVTMLLALAVLMLLPFFMNLDAMTVTMQTWVGGIMRPAPFAPGDAGYALGSDRAGRDMVARLIFGARYTVLIALGIAVFRAAVAIPLGLVAGWYGRGWSRLTRTFSASFSALPTMVLVYFILDGLSTFRPQGMTASALRTGLDWAWVYLLVVTLVGIPRLAEQVRRLTVQVKTEPYIEAAVSVGAPVGRILFRHVLPVIRGDLLVSMAAETAWVLMMMGQLAIFGIFIGDQVRIERDGMPTLILERAPEWSAMLGVNRGVVRTYPWMALYPAVALGLTATAFQLMAEGLRQRWLNR